MRIIEAGLKYRKITVMLFMVLIIAGVTSFIAMPRYEDPPFKILTARVLTLYPGAAPDQVEALVTKPLEESINELEDVSVIESSSYNGVSSIIVKLKDTAGPEENWDKLRQKVNGAGTRLPPGADVPEVQDELNKTSLLIVHLLAPPGVSPASLRETAESWEDEIKQLPGVERIETAGIPDNQVQVITDPAALAARGLSWAQLADALQKRNINIPGGILREGQMGLLVESSGEYRSLEEIADTIIYSQSGGAPVRVRDVATVQRAPARTDVLVETNGRPGVALAIFIKEEYSVSDLEKDLQSLMAGLKKNLPPGVETAIVFNQSASVDSNFSQLWRELIIGMVMVLLVCLAGLNWRTAVIVSLSIPVSAAIGFGPLSWMGISLHQVTIGALIIALGILVDDAIVVNDNIERHLALGKGGYAASVTGTREVAVPILTATVATVSAFAPLMFIPGDIGNFIYALPLVVSVTMLASMIVSLWLTPTLRLWVVREGKRGSTGRSPFRDGFLAPLLERLSVWYEARLAYSLKRPGLTVAAAVLISVGALALLPLVGVQFFPYAERDQFIVDITTPRGYSLYQTAEVAREAAGKAAQKPGVEAVHTYVGRGAPKFYYNEVSFARGETVAQLVVVVEKGSPHTTGHLVDELRKELSGAFPGTTVDVRELEQGPLVGAPIAVRICGDDLSRLKEMADEVSYILKKTPGTVNVHDDMGLDTYTIKVNSSPELTYRYGVAEEDIAYSVRMAVDGLKVSDYREGNDLYPVVLRTGKANEASLEGLSRVWVPSWKSGSVLPLSQVASLDAGWNSGTINRRNMERVITVRAYTDGTLADDILREASGEIENVPRPPGYRIEYGGEDEERKTAFASIGKLSLVVGLLIYIIIAMQFYSLTKPAIVFLSIFLAVSGAVLGLFITGNPLGFMALLGIVSLSGIVVRNGIVLVDFIEVGLREGMTLEGAIQRAGKVRLRPILLTSFTAILGLAPMAVMGSSLTRPIAISIISGLFFSTVLTLLVVPNVYLLAERLLGKNRRQNTGYNILSAGESGEE